MKKNTERKIILLSEEQLNDFYDPSTASNGGGYDQPKYVFRFGGTIGVFSDLSCGEFGSRFSVEFGSKSAYWGSMVEIIHQESNFGKGNEEFLAAFHKEFRIKIPTFEEIDAEKDEFYEFQREQELEEEYSAQGTWAEELEEEYAEGVEESTPTNPADSITLGVYDADGIMWVEE